MSTTPQVSTPLALFVAVTVPMRVREIDSKLPSLALMKLAYYHRARDDDVHFTRHVERQRGEPTYDRVYGSEIFAYSADLVAQFRQHFPDAIVGGASIKRSSGCSALISTSITTIRSTGRASQLRCFTQRGCRLKCGFCVVSKKQGGPRSVNRIADIWRDQGYPRHLHLLDNDFFGQPREQWQARIAEIRECSFRVCFNQGSIPT
jgi:hypothetical protein